MFTIVSLGSWPFWNKDKLADLDAMHLALDGDRLFVALGDFFGRKSHAGLAIVDISNPRKIQQIGWWNPWQADTLQNLWFNSPRHTNQLVLDQKRQRVLLSAGDSELRIVDVSNPRRPELFASYGKPENGLAVWGLTSADEHIYLGYIKTLLPFRGTWSGIKAVKLQGDR